ncbi:hypothetical protein E4U13_005446 [Claviceps humidiphila]|uniref:Uncharacterized protein n=1 Tax=Claviceps humidiphila TaxID=1294629 RepID=A0A9P7TX54_9HYPO|nr:hypothetical protein E4U13_005446 [Claviceps humidiphila]
MSHDRAHTTAAARLSSGLETLPLSSGVVGFPEDRSFREFGSFRSCWLASGHSRGWLLQSCWLPEDTPSETAARWLLSLEAELPTYQSWLQLSRRTLGNSRPLRAPGMRVTDSQTHRLTEEGPAWPGRRSGGTVDRAEDFNLPEIVRDIQAISRGQTGGRGGHLYHRRPSLDLKDSESDHTPLEFIVEPQSIIAF